MEKWWIRQLKSERIYMAQRYSKYRFFDVNCILSILFQVQLWGCPGKPKFQFHILCGRGRLYIYTYAQQSAHQNIMHQIQLRSIPCPPPSESASRDFSCLFSRWRWTVSWSRTPVNSGSHTHNVMHEQPVERCHQSRWAGGHGNLSTQLCWHMLTMLRMKEHQFKQSTRRLRRLIKWYFWIFDTGRWARKIEA